MRAPTPAPNRFEKSTLLAQHHLTFKQLEIVLLESLWFFLTLPTLNKLSAFPEPSPAHSK
jgi:hypothetical protein